MRHAWRHKLQRFRLEWPFCLFLFCAPSVGADTSTAFYRSALLYPKPNFWYSNVAVGHNKLASTIKRLCEQGGLSGYRTNHSLRATAAIRMYDKGRCSLYAKRQVNHTSMWKSTADCLLFKLCKNS